MSELLNSPLAGKLLDLSVALFVLFVVGGLSMWFNWKQYQRNQSLTTDHAVEVARLNAEHLAALTHYADSRNGSEERLRAIVEQINAVLRKVDGERPLHPVDHKLLSAVAERVGVTLSDLK